MQLVCVTHLFTTDYTDVTDNSVPLTGTINCIPFGMERTSFDRIPVLSVKSVLSVVTLLFQHFRMSAFQLFLMPQLLQFSPKGMPILPVLYPLLLFLTGKHILYFSVSHDLKIGQPGATRRQ